MRFKTINAPPRKIAEDESGNLRFRIVGDHPHSGREGVVKVDENDKVTVHNVLGTDMYEVRFPDGEGAFAKKANLKPIYVGEEAS